MMQDCDCFHPLYLDIDDTRHNKLPCDLTPHSLTHSCIKAVMSQFSGELRSCPCNQACYETQYSTMVSSALWPANQFKVGLVRTYQTYCKLKYMLCRLCWA